MLFFVVVVVGWIVGLVVVVVGWVAGSGVNEKVVPMSGEKLLP